ncbi:MAG: hypothetical protein ACJA11_001152 [Glaciecola sp.]
MLIWVKAKIIELYIPSGDKKALAALLIGTQVADNGWNFDYLNCMVTLF